MAIYDKDVWKVEVIDLAKNDLELDNKEKHWIKYYESTNNTKGYNIHKGGMGGKTTKIYNRTHTPKIKKKMERR